MTNFTTEEEWEAQSTVLLTYKEEWNNKDNIWYLDGRASDHMCRIKEFFIDLNKSVQSEFMFVDLSKKPVKGKPRLWFK